MVLIFTDAPDVMHRGIGAYRIATELRRKGVEVEVIDYTSYWDLPELIKYLNTFTDVDWWGISAKFSPPGTNCKVYLEEFDEKEELGFGLCTGFSIHDERRLIQYIKSRKGKIVLGGAGAESALNIGTSDPRLSLWFSDIDVVSIGNSDIAVLAIHNYLTNDGPLTYDIQNGLVVVDCDKAYPLLIMDNLETEYVENDFIQPDETFPIEISRGCIFHCAYCFYSHIGKKAGTYIRSKESIKHDIVDRYTKYGTTTFVFLDDTFNDSVEKMTLIEEIRNETGIPFKFWSFCRLDLLAAQPAQVALIDKIGWASMTMGVETFNRASGKAVGKGADPEKLKDFLVYLRNTFPDLRMQVNMIIGLPQDSRESVLETIQWFVDNPQITQFVKINCMAIPNPKAQRFNSKISLNPEKYGFTIIDSNSLNHLNWKSAAGMTRTEALELSKEMSALLRGSVYSGSTNRDGIATLHATPARSMDDTGKIVNSKVNHIQNYITQKIASRHQNS